MNRYINNPNNVGNRFDGKRFFKTTTYPNIPVSSSDVYIIATSEDYLDKVAVRFYNDPTLWWVIAQANNIKGTICPPVGKQLRIPGEINSIISRFNSANS